jgi:hypothetical protein
MRQNGFFFRIPHEKLGKKYYGKFFFLVIWGSNTFVKKCYTLTVNINGSKAKRTHFILVYVKTNLPQHKKAYLIIWLSGFWALENPKVGVS